ncbi:SocA family protein [Serratia ureilytica]|uniref:Panacea domain-containing protein n=1 Tax=Serratia ureilytica TaxID=300181 RepID=UPI001CBFA50C|nr:type II toxin-antitoxin system antitoxin SocA domain-containing protein [Serratia ureilytica]UAN25196.1 SocA family protein [Serratia ureilytica]
MARASINQVADYLLCFAQEHGDVMTPLKLQKMVFYADAWFLAINNEELVSETFQAWVHGPVSRELYIRFADYKWRPITEDIQCPEIDADVKDHLDEIYNVFGGFSAYELEQLTHQEQPWIEARAGLPESEPCQNPISKETTRKFYAEMAA